MGVPRASSEEERLLHQRNLRLKMVLVGPCLYFSFKYVELSTLFHSMPQGSLLVKDLINSVDFLFGLKLCDDVSNLMAPPRGRVSSNYFLMMVFYPLVAVALYDHRKKKAKK